MSVFIQRYSESDVEVVEVSLDGGGSVRVEKHKDGNVKVIATSKYDPDNPKIICMDSDVKTEKQYHVLHSCVESASKEFARLYFDPGVISMVGIADQSISVGFKTQELLDSSDYIPNEFDGFQVVKRVVGDIKPL